MAKQGSSTLWDSSVGFLFSHVKTSANVTQIYHKWHKFIQSVSNQTLWVDNPKHTCEWKEKSFEKIVVIEWLVKECLKKIKATTRLKLCFWCFKIKVMIFSSVSIFALDLEHARLKMTSSVEITHAFSLSLTCMYTHTHTHTHWRSHWHTCAHYL